jgi:aspartate dehydrogenase
VVLIGFGAIGGTVWRLLSESPGQVRLAGLLLRDAPARDRPGFAQAAACGVPVAASLQPLLPASADPGQPRALVVECAGHDAVDRYGLDSLETGCDLMVVSSGALADASRLDRLLAAARAAGRQLIVPAGAIGGLDILGAARMAGLHEVRYRSRKPPAAWMGTPAQELLDLAALREATVFYRGDARAAARDYPRNANVVATLALATVGFEQTRVELVADPGATGNFHEIDAQGVSGSISLRIEGLATPANPRTSMITAFSVARAVLDRRQALVI